MKTWKKFVVAACLVLFAFAAFGCSEEGPMEKAGKKIDQAAEDAGDAAKDAGDAAKKLFE
ncbi:transport-associated protein [Desulfovibrio sp. Fe33]|uniref:transport-associated protein n=1 Tax=Desulfovibrio sp. Fe33 TaxID=3020842 RepID=UPI00234D572B|nr:transport-associated protein [Desulfovibrio sp. Fe33]